MKLSTEIRQALGIAGWVGLSAYIGGAAATTVIQLARFTHKFDGIMLWHFLAGHLIPLVGAIPLWWAARHHRVPTVAVVVAAAAYLLPWTIQWWAILAPKYGFSAMWETVPTWVLIGVVMNIRPLAALLLLWRGSQVTHTAAARIGMRDLYAIGAAGLTQLALYPLEAREGMLIASGALLAVAAGLTYAWQHKTSAWLPMLIVAALSGPLLVYLTVTSLNWFTVLDAASFLVILGILTALWLRERARPAQPQQPTAREAS